MPETYINPESIRTVMRHTSRVWTIIALAVVGGLLGGFLTEISSGYLMIVLACTFAAISYVAPTSKDSDSDGSHVGAMANTKHASAH